MKKWLVLVAGLLAVMLLNNLEDYLSQADKNTAAQDYDAVDYYLTDFSLSAITATGKVSHTLDGQYLAYWHNRDSSFIVAPRIVSRDESGNSPTSGAISLTAEEAVLDHGRQQAELNGNVDLNIASEVQSRQLELKTSFLRYDLADRHISTDQEVNITGPDLQLQGTGLDSRLDEAYLRLNANVKSTYQPAKQ